MTDSIGVGAGSLSVLSAGAAALARATDLDTALAVLDDTTIAYYPPAFGAQTRAALLELFPDAIEVADADANVLGLNAVSDGLNVVLPEAATGFAEQLRAAGFRPIGVDLSELLKGGGSVKCCTLEVYR